MVLPVRGGATMSPRWPLPIDLGVFKVDGFDFDQREVAFAVLRRTHLPGDGVAGAQVELADLRR